MCSPSPSIQKNAERMCTFLCGIHTSQLCDAPSVPSYGTRICVPAGILRSPALSTRSDPALPTPGVLLRTWRRSFLSRRYLRSAQSTQITAIAQLTYPKPSEST